jgi:hypothetical protein
MKDVFGVVVDLKEVRIEDLRSGGLSSGVVQMIARALLIKRSLRLTYPTYQTIAKETNESPSQQPKKMQRIAPTQLDELEKATKIGNEYSSYFLPHQTIATRQ